MMTIHAHHTPHIKRTHRIGVIDETVRLIVAGALVVACAARRVLAAVLARIRVAIFALQFACDARHIVVVLGITERIGAGATAAAAGLLCLRCAAATVHFGQFFLFLLEKTKEVKTFR